MKTFDEIYNELQNDNNINELNNEWKKTQEKNKKNKKIAVTVILIIDLLILLILFAYGSMQLATSIMPVILVLNIVAGGIILASLTLSKEYIEFVGKYKDFITKKIISNFYDNLEYFPEKEMPEYIYREARYEHYDNYSSNDYLEAQIDNKYSIQMADVSAEEIREYEDQNGEKREEKITVFSGIFAKIIIDKSINAELRIMQDKKLKFDKNRLNMDSSEFEKYFDVKSSDPVIAMQILTADVMEELVEFENKTNMKYDIYIKDNEIYLRFHLGALNVNVWNLKNSVLDPKVTQKSFYMLNFTYNLSKKLINILNDIQL